MASGTGKHDLPLDSEGICMCCLVKPPRTELVICRSCASPWHMACLKDAMSEAPLGGWDCPDCDFNPSTETGLAQQAGPSSLDSTNIISQVRAINEDTTLTEKEKARKRQELLSSKSVAVSEQTPGRKAGKRGSKRSSVETAEAGPSSKKEKKSSALDLLDQSLCCPICQELCDRPVSTPCGHNFCLKCFQKQVGMGKRNCAKCRTLIPASACNNPRINSALVMAIRHAKAAAAGENRPAVKPQHFMANDDRPDQAFTTERAQKTGLANACSGRIFVTIPADHFGPITEEYDPVNNTGVLVGAEWTDRMACRQWGAHFPHVAGIAGQSDHGAQSVALSGGYEDDEDHGEYFIYTGSGGRDLSGNKRTNKEQSKEQVFEKMNKALKVSCREGYPVRVVRSHKEKKSSYAPKENVRYDGIYRIEKCWRKPGKQNAVMCRFLFVRCDNEPAPWDSGDIGDRPRKLPAVDELKGAKDVFERSKAPAWDWKEDEGVWGWTRPPPESRSGGRNQTEGAKKKRTLNLQQKLLREFGCQRCRFVLNAPLTTPCGHNFCKACLEAAFGAEDIRDRAAGIRSLRVKKVVKLCPACKNDITDFMTSPQINREMVEIIEGIQAAAEKAAREQTEIEAEGPEENVKNADDGGDETELGENVEIGESGEKKGKRKGKEFLGGGQNGIEDGAVGPPQKRKVVVNGGGGKGGCANGDEMYGPSENGLDTNGVTGNGVNRTSVTGASANGTDVNELADEECAAGATRAGGKVEDPAVASVEQVEREAEFQKLVAKHPTFGEEVLRDMLDEQVELGGGLADLAMLLKNLKNDAARAQRRQSGEGPGGSGRSGAPRGRGRGRKRKSTGRKAADEERVIPDSEEDEDDEAFFPNGGANGHSENQIINEVLEAKVARKARSVRGTTS